mgnify:CR=1 FL=1
MYSIHRATRAATQESAALPWPAAVSIDKARRLNRRCSTLSRKVQAWIRRFGALERKQAEEAAVLEWLRGRGAA